MVSLCKRRCRPRLHAPEALCGEAATGTGTGTGSQCRRPQARRTPQRSSLIMPCALHHGLLPQRGFSAPACVCQGAPVRWGVDGTYQSGRPLKVSAPASMAISPPAAAKRAAAGWRNALRFPFTLISKPAHVQTIPDRHQISFWSICFIQGAYRDRPQHGCNAASVAGCRHRRHRRTGKSERSCCPVLAEQPVFQCAFGGKKAGAGSHRAADRWDLCQ